MLQAAWLRVGPQCKSTLDQFQQRWAGRRPSLQYAATRTIKASWPNRTSLATKTERASRATRASWTNRASRASICSSNYSTAFMATFETRSTKAISRLPPAPPWLLRLRLPTRLKILWGHLLFTLKCEGAASNGWAKLQFPSTASSFGEGWSL